MILFFLTLLISSPVQASYFENCEIQAEVLEADGPKLKIRVLSFKMIDGHGDQRCKEKKSKELSIELEKGTARKGMVSLVYSYYDGMGPDGVVYSHRWRLKDQP